VAVPFNRPHIVGDELDHVGAAIEARRLSGGGEYSRRCAEALECRLGAARVLLTHSGTGALDMAAILADAGPGDEVILPSFTFTSTANAWVLRGATPVFVDIREDTLNLDESRVSEAITERTRAIAPVHYGGVACDMEAIGEIASGCGAVVIEDAAQALGSSWRGRPLGSFGEAAALSFHETKNIVSGEGGALIVNSPEWVERAEVVLEKGTNRTAFHRGETDRYTWTDVGSSFLASEITAAFLWAQLEHEAEIRAARHGIWGAYREALAGLESSGRLRLPVIPGGAEHNAHLFYLLLDDREDRDRLIERLAEADVAAVFHYVPLHSSPAGRRFGRTAGELPVTDDISDRLLRLPLWVGMSEVDVSEVVDAVERGLAA